MARTMHELGREATSGPRAAGRRKAIAVLLAALCGGCVLPLQPEFEDPERNTPPYLIAASPEPGSIVTAAPTSPVVFEVRLGDQNLGDELYLRWVFNWPPYRDTTRQGNLSMIVPAATDDNPARVPVSFTPDCFAHTLPNTLKQHTVTLIISDRPYLGFEDYRAVPKDAHQWVLSWTLNLECP